MASGETVSSTSSSSSSSSALVDSSISGIQEKHLHELENLTLTTQPVRTFKYFFLAVLQCLAKLLVGGFSVRGFLMMLSILAGGIGLLTATVRGSQTEHLQEVGHYVQFGLWWLALGVASSIGLGSGLHTFVLYLGPHIALFTIKAVQCGRVDLKAAPYDTIQLKSSPSWLDRDCSEFGSPLYASDIRVPFSSILPQIQLEAILWGIGTALGELPPYFISRAAYLSGNKAAIVKEEDRTADAKKDGGIITRYLKRMEERFLAHSQHLNFLTILVLASVPNPLFDLAGIMCGQLGIPFWKFFTATLIGKALIKTHIQTALIILICNNQLLDLVENRLIWVLKLVPGLDSHLPNIIRKLHLVKEKYMTASPQATSEVKGKKWDISLSSVWNTVVLLVLLNFTMKIVTSTAQSFLKELQEKEMASLAKPTQSSETLEPKT